MSAPQSGAEILERIKPRLREDSTFLCLRPDLLDAWENATAELEEARAKDVAAAANGGRLNAGGSSKRTRELAEKVQALEEQIEETQVRFTMRAMRQDRWQALCDSHPPRKGNELDMFSGYNREAVLDAAVRECLIDPVFDQESWSAFLEVCNPSEWAELRNLCQSVNRSVTDAPKSPLASQILARRGTGSRQRAAGE